MKDGILYHHSANPSPKNQAQTVIEQHKRSPKIKQAGGYHYFVEANGQIVQFHPEDFIAHHAGNWAMNLRSIGICLAGDFTRHPPSKAQIESLTRLTVDIQTRWGIPDSRILLHREVKPTACPGIDLRPFVSDEKLNLLKTKLKRLQQAETTAEGARKKRLTRLIARILKMLG